MSKTYINSDAILDGSIGGDKLSEDVSKKISDSNTIVNTLLQAFTEAKGNTSHLEDPFVRANLIPIPFEDAEVKRVLVENYDTDGDGELYYRDVKDVANMRNLFMDNTNTPNRGVNLEMLISFDELRFFDGIRNNTPIFIRCINLKSVEFPKSTTIIQGLSKTLSLHNISISDNITEIGGSGLRDSAITELYTPENVKKIGNSACNGTKELEKVILTGVTEIDQYGFYSSTLNSIYMPKVEKIGFQAFHGCKNIGNTILPDSLTEIGIQAFYQAENFDIVGHCLPANLTTLNREVFCSTGITEITIHKNVTRISGSNVMAGCKKLLKATFEEGFDFSSAEGWSGSNMFANCSALAEINLPDSITRIPDAFGGGDITTLNLNDNITYIGKNALRYKNLHISKLPNSLTYLGDFALYGVITYNTISEIPESVTYLGTSCLNADRNQGYLPTNGLYVKNPVPPTLNTNAFNEAIIIYVPDDSVEAYKTATNWSNYTIKPVSERPA